MDKLKGRFHKEMVEIYKEAGKIGYRPIYFLQMVIEKGGYEAAKQLIYANTVSDGFTRLWELKRLDLSVENHAIKDEYKELFTDEERKICIKRLNDYEFKPSRPDKS